MLKEGVLAPEFELMDQDENPHKLSDYRGKEVVLYFYPKDDTPGCTKEACSFRDSFAEFRQKGLAVLGVSKDSPKSHAKFQEKYSLPFPLLSDTSTEMIQAYEAWGKKKFMGKEFTGTLRITYIIDEDGKAYEIRNRVTLCRCGKSKNKPFCDASHIEEKYNDGLPIDGGGEIW